MLINNNMDNIKNTTLNSEFLISTGFHEKNARLYHTIDKTLSKPFNFKNANHRQLYFKLKNEIIHLVQKKNR